MKLIAYNSYLSIFQKGNSPHSAGNYPGKIKLLTRQDKLVDEELSHGDYSYSNIRQNKSISFT
jgi:hypothetical protein